MIALVIAAVVLFIALVATLTLLLGNFAERIFRAGREKGFNEGWTLGLAEGRSEIRAEAMRRCHVALDFKRTQDALSKNNEGSLLCVSRLQ